jgi:hypothetical protein
MAYPFILSIEPVDGETYVHGYHLGTDERVARLIAAEHWQHPARNGKPIRTVALMRFENNQRRIIDVYDGQWQSEYLNSFDDEIYDEPVVCRICGEEGHTWQRCGND